MGCVKYIKFQGYIAFIFKYYLCESDEKFHQQSPPFEKKKNNVQ